MTNKKHPDEEVANRIIVELRKQELLSDTTISKLHKKIISGTISGEDWKLDVELDRVEIKK